MNDSGNSGQSLAERTRRQLEELDALLQQLLAVPVVDDANGSEETSGSGDRTVAASNALGKDADTAGATAAVNDPLVLALDEARSLGSKSVVIHRPSPHGRPELTAAAAKEDDRHAAEIAPDKAGRSMVEPPRESTPQPASPALDAHDAAADLLAVEGTNNAAKDSATDEAVLRFPESSHQATNESLPIHRIDPPHEHGFESDPDWPPTEQWLAAGRSRDGTEQESVFGQMRGSLSQIAGEEPARSEPAGQAIGAAARNLLGWTGVIFLLAAAALGIGALLGWTW